MKRGGRAGPRAVFVEEGGDGADQGVGGEGGVYVGGSQAEGGGGGGDPVVDVGGTGGRGGAGFGGVCKCGGGGAQKPAGHLGGAARGGWEDLTARPQRPILFE